jgi:hypothetical protein
MPNKCAAPGCKVHVTAVHVVHPQDCVAQWRVPRGDVQVLFCSQLADSCTEALLNIEPRGSEFGGRNTWKSQNNVVYYYSPTHDSPKWVAPSSKARVCHMWSGQTPKQKHSPRANLSSFSRMGLLNEPIHAEHYLGTSASEWLKYIATCSLVKY